MHVNALCFFLSLRQVLLTWLLGYHPGACSELQTESFNSLICRFASHVLHSFVSSDTSSSQHATIVSLNACIGFGYPQVVVDKIRNKMKFMKTLSSPASVHTSQYKQQTHSTIIVLQGMTVLCLLLLCSILYAQRLSTDCGNQVFFFLFGYSDTTFYCFFCIFYEVANQLQATSDMKANRAKRFVN